jgi:hypothetical protein
MKRTITKLKLRSETIRTLTSVEISAVQGGVGFSFFMTRFAPSGLLCPYSNSDTCETAP